jgi:hypothetical protein
VVICTRHLYRVLEGESRMKYMNLIPGLVFQVNLSLAGEYLGKNFVGGCDERPLKLTWFHDFIMRA